MPRATTQEIVAAYRERYSVHVESRVLFHGVAGHYYVVPRALTDRQMAQVTPLCGNAEVCLMRVNDTHMVYVGEPGMARAGMAIPHPGGGIEEFEWISHTHPLEQARGGEMVARGATPRDYEALGRVFALWGQRQSRVIVCRGGRVVSVAPFVVQTPRRMTRGPW